MMYKFFKRLMDIVFGLLGAVIFVLALIVIKVAYLLTGDFHRVVFRQERVGKKGRKFKILKFRSMRYDAEEELKRMLKEEKYKKQWDKYQKIDDDPRITKVGKVIRGGSIDEIPQFLNVLVGQMTLIGPRPLVTGELEEHKGDPKKYFSVKPGITGYWTTRGRSDVDYEERLKMEYYYIDNQSFALDVKIFFRTIGAVFGENGAK